MGLLVAAGGVPKIYVHSADLTGTGRVSNLSLKANTQDVTTFADAGVRRKVGTTDFSYRFEGLFDAAAQQSHEALNDLRQTPRIVSIYPEGDETGKDGILLYSALAEQYEVGISVGEAVPVRADITQEGVAEVVQSLGTKRSMEASTTVWPSLDNGTASYAGGRFVIHVFAFSATGGNARWQALLQHSSDNGVTDPYTNITTIDITAVGAQQTAFEGTVKQFLRVRWVLDATSGSLLAHGAVKRN